MLIDAWVARAPGEPLSLERREARPEPGEVLLAVAGCGVCHTDLGFFYEGVPTRHPFPLTLGHEISGTVMGAGHGAEPWIGRSVIVPAVIPCGACEACTSGHASICPRQIFPGNDVHGGFATHVVVPANGLCPVPESGLDLATFSVVADAVSTPYEAVRRAGIGEGDLAVFVGAGGVGGFGVQIASALGARVVAIDTDPARLEPLAGHGAGLTLDARTLDFKAIREAVRGFARQHGVPTWRRKIFETSGSPGGQSTAFGLLEGGGYLGVIGFTPEKVALRLSNLMALDATARGNWGCSPEHYPEIVRLILDGRIALAPFVEKRPLSSIMNCFEELHARGSARRIVLVPES